MAELAQLEAALKGAHSAGDIEGARKLAQAIQSKRSEPKAKFDNPVVGAIDSFTDGVLFGFGDEITAAEKALLGQTPEGDWFNYSDSFGKRYDDALKNLRNARKNFYKENPIMANAANIAGAIAMPMGAVGNVIKYGGKLAKTAKAAGIGGAVGGVYGFGQGEGGFENRVNSAGEGALFGAGGGAASLPITHAAQKSLPALKSLISKQDRVKLAENIVADSIKTQRTQDALDHAVREGQDEFMVVDSLGHEGQRMLSGVTRSTPEVAQNVVEKLDSRQAGQSGRVSNFIAEAFDAPQSAKATKEGMEKARSATADINYQSAREGAKPVDVRNALSIIDERVAGMKGGNIALDEIDKKLLSYRNRLEAPSPKKSQFPDATAVQLSDFDRVMGVKRSLQDRIGESMRAGRKNEARELSRVVKELDGALEQSSEGYRLANDSFAKASREIDQIDAGKAAGGSRKRAEDNVRYFENLTDAEKSAYRAGYADQLIGRIENSADGVNTTRKLTSQKFQKEAQSMAVDPALLKRRLAREGQMFETRNRVKGNSITADNNVDINVANNLNNSGGVLSKLLQLRVADAARDATWTAANMARGRGAGTKAEMAAILTAQGEKGRDLLKRLMIEKKKRDQNLRRLQSKGAAVGGLVAGHRD